MTVRTKVLKFIVAMGLMAACGWLTQGAAGVVEGAAFPSGAEPSHRGIIRISGSDTMLLLTRALAESYMRIAPRVSVHAWGGGTAHGLEDLIRGKVEICAASRPLQPKEVIRLADGFGAVGFATPVAKEALSVFLNSRNPVRGLSMAQLRAIYVGAITDWKEVGGNPGPIRVIRRPSTSGTYAYFQDHVLGGEAYTKRAETAPDNRAIVNRVTSDPSAIGYGGLAYGRELHCRIDGIEPTEEEIRSDRYPITRYLYLVTTDQPRGEIQRFIDWVLSTQGQSIVRSTGYIALW